MTMTVLNSPDRWAINNDEQLVGAIAQAIRDTGEITSFEQAKVFCLAEIAQKLGDICRELHRIRHQDRAATAAAIGGVPLPCDVCDPL